MPTKQEISECLVCQKPLGQESRDMDWRVCKEHRKCQKCSGPLVRGDVHLAHSSAIEEIEFNQELKGQFTDILQKYLLHSRCQLNDSAVRPDSSQDPSILVKQSYIDWLNLYRLMSEPNMDLSQQTNEKEADLICERIVHKMSLEQKFIFMARLESAVAHVSIAIKSDSKEIKKKLDAREAKKFEQATKQAQVSGRPASKPENDETEILIAAFAQKNELSDVAARKLWKERSKSIQSLIKSGFPESAATEMVDSMLRQQGRIK